MSKEKNIKGYWMLVLHSHLPFVRHPEYNDSLEERWLYEAILETYIPLLDILERLSSEGIDFRITISLTPPLCAMLTDPLLQGRASFYISKMLSLAEKEFERTKDLPAYNRTASMYLERFRKARDIFEDKYNKNILSGFKKFQDDGIIEIITSGATHGYLPLMSSRKEAVRGQVLTGINDYEMHFGRKPRGIWNSECGYYPGLEDILKEGGIRYFFVDTHGVLYSDKFPKYGVFAPLKTPNGIAYFGRDTETSHSVWSAKEGYPGGADYREFYRDIGFDLDYDYIKPYIHESGLRISTGFKYHKITGITVPMGDKQLYDPERASRKAAEDAVHFIFRREEQIEILRLKMDREPVIVSLYDSELFGHWWYEGPEFLYNCIKLIGVSKTMSMITPSEYLDKYPVNQVALPPMSSWGYKGYNEFWLNDSNDWIYPHLDNMAENMTKMADSYKDFPGELADRARNQAARELLLAQSSDWAFIMKTNTMAQYAVRRMKEHIYRFNRLYSMVKNNAIDNEWLTRLEGTDNIFQKIDYHVYATSYDASSAAGGVYA
jgi:1,4-alpha-glucan branching enzyme